MVRLKVVKKTAKGIAKRFQFHYGSVKRTWASRGIGVTSRFQFHYGSVKRKQVKIPHKIDKDFNSTMVRLKG